MDFLTAIRRDSDRFYATAQAADPTRPVPSCPDWTIADLVGHLGQVQWFWGTDVESRASRPEEIGKPSPGRPADYHDLVAWGRAQADRLVRVLEATPDDVPVWTWAPDESGRNVGFVRRHQVQEAAVHRWDLEQAASGRPQPIESDVAADAIDEYLTVTLPWHVRPDEPLSGSLHLHCTDVAGEWFIHPDGRVEPIHAKGDAAIRGTASDLLLALYGRLPLGDLDVVGDATLAHELVTRVEN